MVSTQTDVYICMQLHGSFIIKAMVRIHLQFTCVFIVAVSCHEQRQGISDQPAFELLWKASDASNQLSKRHLLYSILGGIVDITRLWVTQFKHSDLPPVLCFFTRTCS